MLSCSTAGWSLLLSAGVLKGKLAWAVGRLGFAAGEAMLSDQGDFTELNVLPALLVEFSQHPVPEPRGQDQTAFLPSSLLLQSTKHSSTVPW